MYLNDERLQFLANHAAVEEWFGGPIPARLRNALARRDFAMIAEISRVQIPTLLTHDGYLTRSEALKDRRGFRTSSSEIGRDAVAAAGIKTNLTDDEIEKNIREFGFEPMDGEKNARTGCSPYTPNDWVTDRVAQPQAAVNDTPAPRFDEEPCEISREQQELLEDLRAEYAKESSALDDVRGRLEKADPEIPPLRRRARFLETLLARYESAYAKAADGTTRQGLGREFQRVRKDLDDVNARLATVNAKEYLELEERAAALEAMTKAILEAIDAVGKP